MADVLRPLRQSSLSRCRTISQVRLRARVAQSPRREGDSGSPRLSTELTLLAAFMAGLIGTAHCLGMCGGIAAALGMNARQASPGRGAAAFYALLFGVGRVAGYSLIGALAGLAGKGFGEAVDVPTWSAVTRIATGAMLLLIGLQVALHWRLLAPIEQGGARIWARIAPLAKRFIPVRAPQHALALGLLWGWLPCGLVYSVLLLAMLTGSPAESALLMAAFGLGTLPSMTAVSLSASQVGRTATRGPLRRLAGVALVAFGLWTAAVPLWHMAGAGGEGHHHHAAPVPATTNP